MAKQLKYIMSQYLIEKASTPLRRREQAMLLLLYTIRSITFDIACDERSEEIWICIDKMSRVFYVMDNKIFSMRFPFHLEVESEYNVRRIYDINTGLEVESVLLSALISIFERIDDKNDKQRGIDFGEFIDMIVESENLEKGITAENLWTIVKYLMKCDLGYLRYDHDENHDEKNQNIKNPKMHPIDHIDIYYDNSVTCKIGVKKELSYEQFRDILDLNSECSYVE